jgi:streptogramin lyase
VSYPDDAALVDRELRREGTKGDRAPNPLSRLGIEPRQRLPVCDPHCVRAQREGGSFRHPLWVVGVWIDPDSREEVATFNAGAKPRGIAAGEGAVWVANGFDNELTIFDPAQDRVDDRVPLAGPKDVAVGFGAAWVANVTDTTVVRIDPDTHDPERIAEGTALALGTNSVWIANGKTLRRFDPETRKPVGRPFTLRFPATQLAVDEDGVVWVTHQGDDAVSRLDPAGGASQIEGVGDAPTGIAVGGGSVWVASSLGRSLIRIGPESRKVEQAIPLGSSPKGVVVAAGSVWVTTQAAG